MRARELRVASRSTNDDGFAADSPACNSTSTVGIAEFTDALFARCKLRVVANERPLIDPHGQKIGLNERPLIGNALQ